MEIRTWSRVHVATPIHWREVLGGGDLWSQASRHLKEKEKFDPFLKRIILNPRTA
jgi:hypothetical protein